MCILECSLYNMEVNMKDDKNDKNDKNVKGTKFFLVIDGNSILNRAFYGLSANMTSTYARYTY